MDILGPEQEIVDRLKDQLATSVHVEAYPNDPGDFDFVNAGGAALVRYQGSAYGLPDPNEENTLLQERTPQWTVALLNRSLREKDGHGGVYPLIEATRRALTGFTPAATTNPEGSPLYPIRDGFVSREKGKWIYQITFAHVGPEAEA
jgi:hypothetical protein